MQQRQEIAGVPVADAAEAAFFSAQPEANVEYHPGDLVKLRACVPDWELELIQQREGRPCPRVELEPENGDASALTFLSEHTALFGAYWGAATEDMTARERKSLVDRIAGALTHPAMTKAQEDAVAQVVAAYSKKA